MKDTLHRVVIVGGGISGLSAAYFLEKYAAQAGVEMAIDLLEARSSLGGVILTERVEGCLLEGGPDSFLALKPAGLELCRELGLSDHVVPSNDDRRKTFVLRDGRLRKLPDGLMFVVPSRVWPLFGNDLFSLGGKLRLAAAPLLSPPRPNGQDVGQDVSVAEFIRQRLGGEVLERLAEPLLAAVYGADVDSLSARAVLPQLLALEEKHGSLWRGFRAARNAAPGDGTSKPKGSLFLTLRNGIGELIATLQEKLQTTTVRPHTEAATVRRRPEGTAFCVESRNLQSLGSGRRATQTDAAALIVATPAHAAAKLLRALDPRLAGELAAIRYNCSVTVSFGFEKAVLPKELDGFGFIVPRSERKKLVACTWVSTKFPFRSPPDQLLVRCFLGGARDPAVQDEADHRLVEMALDELGEILGRRPTPAFHRIYRWDRCMPQYAVGHLNRMDEITARLAGHPGLFLAGNGYRGVGIPDCIQSASTAAMAAVRYVQSQSEPRAPALSEAEG